MNPASPTTSFIPPPAAGAGVVAAAPSCIDIWRARASSASSVDPMSAEGGAAGRAGAPGAGAGVTAAAPSCMDMARACCRRASSSIAIGSSRAGAAAGVAAPGRVAAGVPDTAASAIAASPSAAAPSPPAPPPAAASAAAARSCRARSSSIDTRRASASSGSRLGSTPNSNPSPPPPAAPATAAPAAAAAANPLPPSSPPVKTGELISASERYTPGGTSTMCELSLLLTAPRSAWSFSALPASSPKLTMSRATLFFFSFLPILTISFSSASIGLPAKRMILWRWFLFCLCLRASCATWTPEGTFTLPSICSPCIDPRTLPRSPVGVTRTLGLLPARVRTPTVFSGLDCVFCPHRRLTASAWACRRVGA
mmetsp:Transcript_45969/g.146764  ORF Transcript_45969/g.146764 Transcript_45969/m.146764 type:complete len:368 (+) Transcript_45969:216-1319(+)